MASAIKEAIAQQRNLLITQRNMYIALSEEMNSKYEDVLKSNHNGEGFIKAVTWDVAGQLSTQYLGLNDLNITTDQIVRRTLNFSYDNDYDPLSTEMARKDPMNAMGENSVGSYSYQGFNPLTDHEREYLENITPLFEGDRNSRPQQKYRDNAVKNSVENGAEIRDELTGRKADISDLQADHILPWSGFEVPNWMSDGAKEKMANLANGQENFQLINKYVNNAKSDNQVWKKPDGTITNRPGGGAQDITKFATPNQMNVAFEKALEDRYQKVLKSVENNPKGSPDYNKAQAELKSLQDGVIDKNTGKLTSEVRKNNLKALKQQQNRADKIVMNDFIKNGKWSNAKEAGKQALFGKADQNGKKRGGIKDLFIGQVVYYALPPLVFEIKEFFKRKKRGLEGLLKRMQRSAGRLTKYVFSKLKDIFKNIISALSRNFVRNLFNLLIDVLKGALKRVFSILRDFVMSIVSSVKILANKNMSGAEKGNAIMNLMTTTVIAVGVQALFELLPETVPDIITIPIQIIVTAILSSLAMRILEQADLFNVRRGLNVAKIRQVFDESIGVFNSESAVILSKSESISQTVLKDLADAKMQTRLLININYYEDDAWPMLEKINDIFDMGIDFEEEWSTFAS